MNDSGLSNRRKLITYSVLGLLLILVVVYFTSFSFFTIKGVGADTKTVYINDSNGNLKKQFEIKDSSKFFLIQRDTYSVNVVSDEKQSVYEKSLSPISKNELSIETQPQKQSQYLDPSDLACSKASQTKTTFYSCKPSSYGLVSSEPSSQAALNTEALETSGISQSLKPYGVEFIKASARDGSVSIHKVSNDGTTEPRPSISFAGFEDRITDRNFAVANGGKNFSLLDLEKSELLLFDDINQKDPTKVPVPTDKIDPEHFATTLVTGDKNTYLFNYNAELHSHEEDDHSEKTPSQKVLIFDKNGLSAEKTLSSDWFITSIVEGPDDKILLTLNESGDEKYYLFEDGKFKKLQLGVESVESACWLDNGSFYFIANSSSNIFVHDTTSKVSRLVYGGLLEETLVSGISCAEDSMTFRIGSDSDGELGYKHYTLSEENYSGGVRSESVLPFYLEVGDGVVKADVDKNGILVNIIYGGPAILSTQKPNTLETVKQRLRDNDVSVEGIGINFNY